MRPAVPADLPQIDKVQIIDLDGSAVSATDIHEKAANAPMIDVTWEMGQQIAAIFRELKAGVQARCHVPPFGLRFLAANRVICEVSICWACNNMFGSLNDCHFHFAFDGSSPRARELLTILETAVGHPARE